MALSSEGNIGLIRAGLHSSGNKAIELRILDQSGT